jgi:head-tail adaptor
MAYDPIIAPGELRHAITIQAASSTRDAFGEPVSTWATVLVARAKIESTTANAYKELVQDGAIAAQSTDVITMRWPGPTFDIKPGQRVVFQDNNYLIQAVDNLLRRNRVVRMFCMALDGDSN